jgi:hypothetical protein
VRRRRHCRRPPHWDAACGGIGWGGEL